MNILEKMRKGFFQMEVLIILIICLAVFSACFLMEKEDSRSTDHIWSRMRLTHDGPSVMTINGFARIFILSSKFSESYKRDNYVLLPHYKSPNKLSSAMKMP